MTSLKKYFYKKKQINLNSPSVQQSIHDLRNWKLHNKEVDTHVDFYLSMSQYKYLSVLQESNLNEAGLSDIRKSKQVCYYYS
jgi:hypothetical protein